MRKGKLNAPRRVALNASTATLVSDATRPWVTRSFRNLDASITVYWGTSTVAIATGFELKAGEVMSEDSISGPIYMISASGTPSVEVVEVG